MKQEEGVSLLSLTHTKKKHTSAWFVFAERSRSHSPDQHFQATGQIYSPLYTIPLCVSQVHFLPSIRSLEWHQQTTQKGKNREEIAEENLQQADMKDKVKRGGGKLLPKAGERSLVFPPVFSTPLPPLLLSLILFHTLFFFLSLSLLHFPFPSFFSEVSQATKCFEFLQCN